MMANNKDIFDDLYGKSLILNKSLLKDKDVKDFEFESHSSITLNISPLNDRNNNEEELQELIKIIKEQSN